MYPVHKWQAGCEQRFRKNLKFLVFGELPDTAMNGADPREEKEVARDGTPDRYCIPNEKWHSGIRRMFYWSPDVHEGVINYQVKDGDVIVCGYPKTGNIWLSIIVAAIKRQDDLESFEKDPAISNIYLESQLLTKKEDKRPSVFMSHAYWHHLPRTAREGKGKIINIFRNPKDAAVSFYHFHQVFKMYGPWEGPWDVFFEEYINGTVIEGSYFDHVRSFWEHQDKSNALFITYEELRTDPKVYISKVADFIGCPLTEEKLDRIVKMTSFENMKNSPTLNVVSTSGLLVEGGNFVRKGEIGNWKTLFTEDQERRMDEKLAQLCKETGHPHPEFRE